MKKAKALSSYRQQFYSPLLKQNVGYRKTVLLGAGSSSHWKNTREKVPIIGTF
jgi:hypothetical protein